MEQKDRKSPIEATFMSWVLVLLAAIVVLFATLFILTPRWRGESEAWRRDLAVTSSPPGQHPTAAENAGYGGEEEIPAVSQASFSPSRRGSQARAGASSVGQGDSPRGGRVGTAAQELAAREGEKPLSAPGEQLTKAMALVDKGDVNQAIAILEKVLAEDSSNEIALIELGMIHLIDLQDPQAAIPFMERAFRLNTDNKVVLSELIGTYQDIEQAEAGLAFLQGLFDEKPESATLAMGIGELLQDQNRPHEAIPYLEKAVEQSQSDIAYSELGDLYRQTGRLDKSLDAYQKAAEKLQQKFDDGHFAFDEDFGKEELVAANLNIVRVLISQNRRNEAQEIIDKKLKPLYGGDVAQLSKQIEKSNMLFGYNQ